MKLKELLETLEEMAPLDEWMDEEIRLGVDGKTYPMDHVFIVNGILLGHSMPEKRERTNSLLANRRTRSNSDLLRDSGISLFP